MNGIEPPRASPASTIRSGFVCPDDFLGGDYVGGELYDGDAYPAPEVGVVISVGGMQRVHRGLERSTVAAERQGLDTLLFFECSRPPSRRNGVLEIARHREDLYLDRSGPAGAPPNVNLAGRRGWQESP